MQETSETETSATERNAALIDRLLEEASWAEDRAKHASAQQKRAIARTAQGQAAAYYHAARLAGWRPESA